MRFVLFAIRLWAISVGLFSAIGLSYIILAVTR